MSTIYETLRQRLVDVVVNGRGADGSLGTDALQKSIPTGRFRESFERGPLRDPTYPTPMFDRALHVEWVSDEDDPDVNNPLDAPHFRVARVNLTHGVIYGAGVREFTVAVGAETHAINALMAQERGLADAQRIQRALGCPDLLRGGAPIDPTPLACVREGATTLQDLSGGRLLVATFLSLRYEIDNTQDYDP